MRSGSDSLKNIQIQVCLVGKNNFVAIGRIFILGNIQIRS